MNYIMIFLKIFLLCTSLILYSKTNENKYFNKDVSYSFELGDSLFFQDVEVILLVDINNNSYKDIICLTNEAGDIRTQEYSLLIIFENNGNQTFFQKNIIKLESYYYNISYGKINDDEYTDLVLYGDSLCILINDGKGNYEIDNYFIQQYPGRSLSVNKLNSDKFDDIALTNDGDFDLIFSNGTGKVDSIFTYKLNLGQGYITTDIAIVDLNNDAINDISVLTFHKDFADTIYNFLNDGYGNLTFVSKYEIEFYPGYFNWADINNDGNLDVILAAAGPMSSRRLIVLYGNGDGTLSSELEYQTDFWEYSTSDINNDGYEDVILTSGDSLKILLNDFENSNSFKIGEAYKIIIPPIWGSAAKIACGDIDNDGDNDIVISSYISNYGGITVYENSLIITDLKDNGEKIISNEFILFNNYPNPFNPSTTIKYTIPTPPASSPLAKGRTEPARQSSWARLGFVTLKVYDILGREIATLVNERQKPGNYEVQFDGTDLTSGLYFYRLQSGEFIQTKKMLLLK